MVTTNVYGDVKPSDDSTHPLGPEKNFNESMYFNFFACPEPGRRDVARGQGGFLRVGNRANEGYAEVTLVLYQPDGTVLFNWALDIRDADAAACVFPGAWKLSRFYGAILSNGSAALSVLHGLHKPQNQAPNLLPAQSGCHRDGKVGITD